MSAYKAPLRDLQFNLFELFDYEAHYRSLSGYEEVNAELVTTILNEFDKFCSNILSPLNAVGDEEGCTWSDGEVATPSGFKEAYRQYVEAGWPALANEPAYGGQGLPESLSIVLGEMRGTANWSWGMYPGLSHGAVNTIELHGTDKQKQRFLTPLVEGAWTGTMCLTEAHCGTDLGLLRTKAEAAADGSYQITGTKIFISSGEHDLTENIVHIVLARLPDAPIGVKGISLFIIPKFNVNDDGSIGERNTVRCGSIEHKMGIHGNATCVMNFDEAKGYLLGEPNQGLQAMFTFMNTARIGTALQGIAHMELGYQKSLAYAKDRLQMRSVTGPKNPDGPADPIIVHPDVRRMLLTQKALSEGGRMMVAYTGKLVDVIECTTDEVEKKSAEDMLSFMTPIAKAFLTETGFESANLALQCFGGHGYIKEWGVEQNVRDARIGMLYEGTTGIQALDFIGRKVLGSGGVLLQNFTREIHHFCKENAEVAELQEFIEPLQALNKKWGELTLHIGTKAMENADEAGAASVDYLMFSGYSCLAYFWAKAAFKARAALAAGNSEGEFYEAKLKTARFYYQRILPRTGTCEAAILSGADNVMSLEVEAF
ncbi:acyl-CoA dehydrogenase C-terminal domain-containing protein [Luminiphilus sp. nBUS_07]|uniref:acyl-CoA dehydrogenase C-terminal domain-containing protein n=1 Tax=Luminiphilus sp. nBUS_07 TaxID=3395314 RepID=UPI003EBA3CC2